MARKKKSVQPQLITNFNSLQKAEAHYFERYSTGGYYEKIRTNGNDGGTDHWVDEKWHEREIAQSVYLEKKDNPNFFKKDIYVPQSFEEFAFEKNCILKDKERELAHELSLERIEGVQHSILQVTLILHQQIENAQSEMTLIPHQSEEEIFICEYRLNKFEERLVELEHLTKELTKKLEEEKIERARKRIERAERKAITDAEKAEKKRLKKIAEMEKELAGLKARRR